MDNALPGQPQHQDSESQNANDATRGPDSTPNKPKPESLTPGYLRNLISIIALGVLVSGWFLRYTDWFEIVGGLLALTGLFSWIAFMSKVMPEDRLKAMQVWIDCAILSNSRTLPLVGTLGLAVFIMCSFLGTIEVEALRDGGAVSVESVDLQTTQKGGEWSLLPAAGHVRLLVWTRIWCPSQVRVKVSGLPDRIVTVWPFTYTKLQTPDSFRRLVLLFRPSTKLATFMTTLAPGPLILVARHNLEERKREFIGQSLWIGCNSDIEIPSDMVDSWREEIDKQKGYGLLHLWFHPISLGDPVWELHPGETIEIELQIKDEPTGVVRSYACADQYKIQPLPSKVDFRKQVIFNVMPTDDPKCKPHQVVEISEQ